MPPSPEPQRFLDTLRGVIDRLSASDLTAAEAEQLRPRLLQLLAATAPDDAPAEPARDRRAAGRACCGAS